MLDTGASDIIIEPVHFNRYLSTIQSQIKLIKKEQRHSFQFVLPQMQEYSTAIVQFMASPKAYAAKEFIRSIIILDNMLAIYRNLLLSIHVPKEFFINLNHYFCGNLGKQDDEKESLTYATLYLILLFVIRSNQCHTMCKMIRKNLFTNKFIQKLGELNCCEYSQLLRILPIIFSFLFKVKKCSLRNKRIKKISLNLFIINEQGSQHHLLNCLKYLLPGLLINDVKSSSILKFLMEIISHSDDYYLRCNALKILANTITLFPALVPSLIQLGFMSDWGQRLRTDPVATLSIFQCILEQLNPKKIQEWFFKYFTFLQASEASQIHIRILDVLVKKVQPQILLQSIHEGLISKVKKISNQNANLAIPGRNIQWTVMSRLKKLNTNLWLACSNSTLHSQELV